MKKTISNIALIAVAITAMAQEPHNIDTIFGREPTYFYQHWFDTVDCGNTQCASYLASTYRTCWWTASTEVAKRNYTDSALTIIGIAVSVYTIDQTWRYPVWSKPTIDDTTFNDWHEYLRLYKPTHDSLELLAEATFNAGDTARRMSVWSHNAPCPEHQVLPIFEAYFDKAVTVTDSFYVSATNYYSILDQQTFSYPRLAAYPYTYYSNPVMDYCDRCYPQHIKDMNPDNIDPDNWEHHYCDFVFLIFPIIDTTQPRTDTCQTVTELTVASLDSAGALVTWERGRFNRTWQIAYGPAADDPEGYTTLAVTAPMHRLRYLAEGEEYAVRVRANCFDDTTYSEWSDTVRFTYSGHTEGIASATPEGFTLKPNPAHSMVEIASAAPLRRIEAYDMQGHSVFSTEASGTAAAIDISSWPRGTYLVTIHTTAGIKTQKLAVE